MIVKAFRIAVLTSIFSFITIATLPASALSTFETSATRDTESGTDSDPQGPASTGTLFSEVLVPGSDGSSTGFSGPGYARAAADNLGRAAVDVNGVFFSGNQFNELTAVSMHTADVTNNTGSDAAFAYDFFLPGPRLTIADFAGLGSSDEPTILAVYEFRVSLDFGSGFVPFVTSRAELLGGINGHSLEISGSDPLGSTFFSDGFSVFGYQFDSLDSDISGFLAPGETLAAQSSLFVSLTAPGFETGGAVQIGDPLDLSTGAFAGQLTLVPIPPALWLFATGIIGLIAVARRKNRT